MPGRDRSRRRRRRLPVDVVVVLRIRPGAGRVRERPTAAIRRERRRPTGESRRPVTTRSRHVDRVRPQPERRWRSSRPSSTSRHASRRAASVPAGLDDDDDDDELRCGLSGVYGVTGRRPLADATVARVRESAVDRPRRRRHAPGGGVRHGGGRSDASLLGTRRERRRGVTHPAADDDGVTRGFFLGKTHGIADGRGGVQPPPSTPSRR